MSCLTVKRKGYVTRVILDQARNHNAMGTGFWPELKETFKDLDSDPETRAVVLCSNAKNFSVGIDLAQTFEKLSRSDVRTEVDSFSVQNFITEIQQSIGALESCKKPVIAAIHGLCLGGGLDLAAACDIRIASQSAVFSMREADSGLVFDLAAIPRLARIVGEAQAREMAFTAKDVDAKAALKMGLVSSVHKNSEQCIKAACRMAKRISEKPPLSVQASKQVANFYRGKPLPENLDYAVARNSELMGSAVVLEAFGEPNDRKKS